MTHLERKKYPTGRPPLPPEERVSEQVNVRLTKEQYEWIVDVMYQLNLTRPAHVLRKLVQAVLENPELQEMVLTR